MYASLSTHTLRAHGGMVADIIRRLSGQGGIHVTLALADGTRSVGELSAIRCEDSADGRTVWTVTLTGYDRSDMVGWREIPLSEVRTVRQTRQGRCPQCGDAVGGSL